MRIQKKEEKKVDADRKDLEWQDTGTPRDPKRAVREGKNKSIMKKITINMITFCTSMWLVLEVVFHEGKTRMF